MGVKGLKWGLNYQVNCGSKLQCISTIKCLQRTETAMAD